MEILNRHFCNDLEDRKEIGRSGPKEYGFMIEREDREAISKDYFPYTKQIARALLSDKHIVFIGNSLMRAMYKDIISLIKTGDLCSPGDLRVSNEDSYLGDKHIDFVELEANRVFRQAREFQSNRHLIQYFFTTRAMREDLEKTCLLMEETDEKPDVLVVSSGIWDMSRYPSGINTGNSSEDRFKEEVGVAEEYFNRVAMFCRRMRCILPPTTTFIWVIMPPPSNPETQGGFISKNHVSFDATRMRLLEGNVRTAQIVREAGFDVLDMAFHMMSSNFKVFRIKDGVHWNSIATRFMNQLLLGHLTMAWRLEKSVKMRWPVAVVKKITERSEFFKSALDFLKDRNKTNMANEMVHQELRLLSFENFKPDGLMTMEQFHSNLRTLLMVLKFWESTKLNSIFNCFSITSMPRELSSFSQEDVVKIQQMIEEILTQQRDDRPCNRMGKNKALMPPPPPPPLPPILAPSASYGHSGNSERRPISGGFRPYKFSEASNPSTSSRYHGKSRSIFRKPSRPPRLMDPSTSHSQPRSSTERTIFREPSRPPPLMGPSTSHSHSGNSGERIIIHDHSYSKPSSAGRAPSPLMGPSTSHSQPDPFGRASTSYGIRRNSAEGSSRSNPSSAGPVPPPLMGSSTSYGIRRNSGERPVFREPSRPPPLMGPSTSHSQLDPFGRQFVCQMTSPLSPPLTGPSTSDGRTGNSNRTDEEARISGKSIVHGSGRTRSPNRADVRDHFFGTRLNRDSRKRKQ